VFIKVSRALPRFRGDSSLSTWIYRIATNVAYDRLRSPLLTNQEIAQALRLTVDTVKIRLHRARTRLKNELGTGCNFYRDERNELACDPKPNVGLLRRRPPSTGSTSR